MKANGDLYHERTTELILRPHPSWVWSSEPEDDEVWRQAGPDDCYLVLDLKGRPTGLAIAPSLTDGAPDQINVIHVLSGRPLNRLSVGTHMNIMIP
jgi:hypothetical protein